MPIVRLKENEPFEAALRRFKRTIEKTGLLTELRAREFYEKPTAERKRKQAAASTRSPKEIISELRAFYERRPRPWRPAGSRQRPVHAVRYRYRRAA